ncbi:BTB/POZ and MATH domain-containing protein 3-like [Papaver somniferum]|uniref:BTB/POZ and MATH domain-containing protein 3-like n=1 Tax=Papaver somniferum TaxID=3469 RepID=UPI000E6FC204|nr:BTB/POZ and MATH domain-containing protein 3-like [Papaver somniferum]
MPPVGTIVSTNHKMLSSQSIYETVKGSHLYKIIGYSLAKGIGVGKFMSSQTITVGGHDWVIHFYPDGETKASEEHVSLFLKLVSPREVRATFEFKILDQSEKGNHSVHNVCARMFNTSGTDNSWGFPKCIKRSELETSSYLKADSLSIQCTIGIVQNRDETAEILFEEEKHYVIPPSDMIQNLKGLLESEIGSHITFRVGNEFFKAHKSILAARSPVYRAQFFGLVDSPDMETIVIKEFEPFAFKAMLLFLYSDVLPEPCEVSDSDCPFTTTILMQHLLAAADLYDLARLKLMCEAKLFEEMTADTVATTLALAERYRCLQLKTDCLHFAARPENLGEFIKSDGYAYLEKSCPSLLTDLLKTSAVMDKK